MTPRNLTELRKANDNHTQTDRNTTGGISADVLPRGSVLSGTLKIRVLEQMPRRGNPAHSHFLPLLPSPPSRPRDLPQRPHTMKTGKTQTTPGGYPQDEIEFRLAEFFAHSLDKFWEDYYEGECPSIEVGVTLHRDLSPKEIHITIPKQKKPKADRLNECPLLANNFRDPKVKESKDSEREMLMDWHRKWGLDVVPLRLSVEQKEKR